VTEDDLCAHYTPGAEASRLTRSAHGRLEYLRTQELVRRYLPPPPARVLDVGGGPGAHARWIAEDGHHVHLVDPIAHHVQAASAPG
jgi:2-polyprenyl-3-methyl-5-hydroxy-6-metoxy-1,4-benzoquinol methylase